MKAAMPRLPIGTSSQSHRSAGDRAAADTGLSMAADEESVVAGGALLRDERLNRKRQHVEQVLVDRIRDEQRARGIEADGQDAGRLVVVVASAAGRAVAAETLGTAAPAQPPGA